jgi:hypothetical protein
MAILTCSGCAAQLNLPAAIAPGTSVKCPKCGGVSAVEQENHEASLPPTANQTGADSSRQPDQPEPIDAGKSATPKKPSRFAQHGVIAAGIIGAAVGRAAGLLLLIPLFLALLVGLPLHFLSRGKRRRMVPSVAIQLGHGLFVILGAIMLLGGFIPFQGDILMPMIVAGFFMAAAFMVFVWPELITISILTVCQLVAVGMNLVVLTWPEITREVAVGLLAVIYLRIVGVVLMWTAFFTKGKPDPAVGKERGEPSDDSQHPGRRQPGEPGAVFADEQRL